MSETQVTTESQEVDTDNLDTFADDFFGQKKPADSTTNAEVEQDEAASTDEVDTEAQEDPNTEADAEYKEEPPKKKTVQDRIDELVKQREDVKRDADAKLDALRREFEDWKKGTKEPERNAEKLEPTPDDLKEDGEPKYALGEFDPQYIRDLTRFTLNQEREKDVVLREQERRDTEVNQAQQVLQTSWNEKLEVAKTEYPDLVEKGQTLLNGFNNLPTEYAGYLSSVLMSMDKGPDVLYYLSNHPEEAVKIVNSGAQRATLALGRIEAKFLEADAEKLVAKPKISQAPPPPAERARGTNGAFISVAPDTDNLDDFESAFFADKKKK